MSFGNTFGHNANERWYEACTVNYPGMCWVNEILNTATTL